MTDKPVAEQAAWIEEVRAHVANGDTADSCPICYRWLRSLLAERDALQRDLDEQNGTTHALNLAAKLRKVEAERDALEATNHHNLGLLEIIEQVGVDRDALRQRLDDVNTKDAIKTSEINILTAENRKLYAENETMLSARVGRHCELMKALGLDPNRRQVDEAQQAAIDRIVALRQRVTELEEGVDLGLRIIRRLSDAEFDATVRVTELEAVWDYVRQCQDNPNQNPGDELLMVRQRAEQAEAALKEAHRLRVHAELLEADKANRNVILAAENTELREANNRNKARATSAEAACDALRERLAEDALPLVRDDDGAPMSSRDVRQAYLALRERWATLEAFVTDGVTIAGSRGASTILAKMRSLASKPEVTP